MQAIIWLASLAAFLATHNVYAGLSVFVATQLGALYGAMWAARVKRLSR
jgi:hypothetical protein